MAIISKAFKKLIILLYAVELLAAPPPWSPPPFPFGNFFFFGTTSDSSCFGWAFLVISVRRLLMKSNSFRNANDTVAQRCGHNGANALTLPVETWELLRL